ncbi:MmgE/PrpD family protein [Qaidamihabitans albus]|uniref:MmgE/PrpD family protein n=1 Tax=Qaidamihabitans albus TaxID=2795733 RepID=UPI0018F2551D|nr:MmgE/PrpD family protein [Qaidamihabitans albus]
MDISTPTHRLSEYLARAAGTPLPEPVIAKTRLHVLDTIAAILSGSAMPAGRAGLAYARRYACDGPAPIFGTPAMAAPADAALANGMSAHADETDDSHAPSLSHPGCAVVPAVLAVASARNVPGQVLLRAVAAGYDAGTRVGMAIGHPDSPLEGSSISTHAHVGVYAAAAAAAVFMSLDAEQMRAVLSFAAQSAAGTTSWARDPYHVEKAFVFGGMPASNGVRAAQLVESGCLGVADVFAGAPNVLDAYSPAPDPSRLGAGLGEVYEIERTNIKKFAVGSPSQAALQAVLDILADRPVDPGEIERIVIEIPYDLAKVVDGRESPNINVQYLVCGTIIDGRFSFAMAHDSTRFTDHTVRDLMGRAELRYDRSVTGVRQASVDIILRSGETLYAFVATVRGSADNPMSAGEVVEKASDLIKPVVGTPRTDRIVDIVLSLGDGADAASLLDALHP